MSRGPYIRTEFTVTDLPGEEPPPPPSGDWYPARLVDEFLSELALLFEGIGSRVLASSAEHKAAATRFAQLEGRFRTASNYTRLTESQRTAMRQGAESADAGEKAALAAATVADEAATQASWGRARIAEFVSSTDPV